MIRPFNFFVLFIGLFIILTPVHSAQVVRVNGKKILLKLKSTPAKTGTKLIIINKKGKALGILQITKVKGAAALGTILRGRVQKGNMAISKSRYLKLKRSLKNRSLRQTKKQDKEEPMEEIEEQPRQSKREQDSSSKKWMNIRTNLLSDAVGFYNIEGEFFIGPQFSVGVAATSIAAKVNSIDVTGNMIGARINYYMGAKTFGDSFYLSAAGGTVSADFEAAVTNSTTVEKASLSGSYMQAMFGYQWAWTSFNMALGAGVINYSLDDTVSTNSGTLSIPISGALGTMEFLVGYAF